MPNLQSMEGVLGAAQAFGHQTIIAAAASDIAMPVRNNAILEDGLSIVKAFKATVVALNAGQQAQPTEGTAHMLATRES